VQLIKKQPLGHLERRPSLSFTIYALTVNITAAWSSEIDPAYGVVGREIESRQGKEGCKLFLKKTYVQERSFALWLSET
jgi:hypothetical protein